MPICDLLFLLLFLSQQIRTNPKTSMEATEHRRAVKMMADFSDIATGKTVKELDSTDKAEPEKNKYVA